MNESIFLVTVSRRESNITTAHNILGEGEPTIQGGQTVVSRVLFFCSIVFFPLLNSYFPEMLPIINKFIVKVLEIRLNLTVDNNWQFSIIIMSF